MTRLEKTSFFSKSEDIEIEWSDVYKVGVDVILIDSKGKNILDVQKYIQKLSKKEGIILLQLRERRGF